MSSRRGRVVLAGYSPELPDLVCVRALDRAIASGLTVAPPDLPRDLGNRATVWIDQSSTMKSSETLWQHVGDTLQNGQTVLRWYPDNPLATETGRQDAADLQGAGFRIELVPVVPDEIIASTFAGVHFPDQPRVMALTAREDSSHDFWASQDPSACNSAEFTIAHPGKPTQTRSHKAEGRSLTCIGGPGASDRIDPNWFESLPLFSKRILVTRTISQAPVMSRALRELGAEPVELPAIDIIPDPYPEQTRQAADQLPDYDWIIFTSTNGVDVFMEAVRQAGYDARRFGNAKLAAIGVATGERLRRNFIEPDFIPDEFVAEGVINGLRSFGMAGKRILIPRAEIARTALPDGLRALGATVDVVPVYRTIPGTPDPLVIDRIDAGEIDVITFTSSSTVVNLMDMFDGDPCRLKDAVIACIGPITAETAREHGMKVSIVPEEYSIPGLIDALCIFQEELDA
jgi:uroporphyrinogen-III synthase